MFSAVWDSLIGQVATCILFAILAVMVLAYFYKFLCYMVPGPRHQKPLQLKDKTVLITGASSGIGRSMAFEFYIRGSKVILASRDVEKLKELCEELEESGVNNVNKPKWKQLDIETFKEKTDEAIAEEMSALVALAADGKTIDVLVNNAGIMSYGSAKKAPLSVVRRVMEVNFFGQIAVTKSLIDFIPDGGAIVTMGSILGRGVAMPYQAPYSASKHAIQAFFDSLRGEERPQLQILTVSAGYVNSGFGSRALDLEGKPTGKEDPHQLKGYSTEYSAKAIVTALINRETELLLAPFIPRLLLSLRLFTPNLLWWILATRCKEEQQRKAD